MAHTAPWMDPSQMPDTTYQPQHSEWPHSSPVTFNPHAFQLYQLPNSDHSAQNLPGVVSQGFWAGSVPSSGATMNYAEYPETVVEHEHPGGDGEVAVEDQSNECDEVPCPSRTEGKKGSKKRGRDWTEEETWVLVECKRACFEDKGSRYRKQKSSATNWEAIAEAVRVSPDTCGASEKTGDQCRLRWDTLVKSYRLIKERCVESGKEYAEVMADETRSLKLATSLKPEWYLVIDSVSGTARSRMKINPSARKSRDGGAGDGPDSAGMGRTEAGSLTLVMEGGSGLGTESIPPAAGRCRLLKLREVVRRFWLLRPQLRSAFLDLVFLNCGRTYSSTYTVYYSLSRTCEWLSSVQSRSRSEVYDDVSMLMQMRLVHVCNGDSHDGDSDDGDSEDVQIKWSHFHMLEKFLKKLLEKNHVLDSYRDLRGQNHKIFFSRSESTTRNRIRVLTLYECKELVSMDLRGLRNLRSLIIDECMELKEITGWKYLRELEWLEIRGCIAYAKYPDLQDLPSLRVFFIIYEFVPVNLLRQKFDISQCMRLRRLEILEDEGLKESGDLSSLKCLEELVFHDCPALLIVDGLSGVHSLIRLVLVGCWALHSLPDIGHMKELVHIDVISSNVEEIPGIEKLVSLKTLDCSSSKLKHLPDLHHLPKLQKIRLFGTPLIEDDPSSFYFDKEEVSFNCEKESVIVEVSDIGDDEDVLSESSDDEDKCSG